MDQNADEEQEQLNTSQNRLSQRDRVQDATKRTKPWTFLQHNGPMFAPPYKPLPKAVSLKYDGRKVTLSQNAEEVAVYYARKLHLPCVRNQIFNDNFLNEWRNLMTTNEREVITDLSKCDFRQIQEYFIAIKKRQSGTKKKREKKNKNKYGYCKIDGKKQPIRNYKIEPPGIFCSICESEHMGKLKKRVTPEEVTINCSIDSREPEPPPGHRWRDVIHDNTVSWLASWVSNVTNEIKYVILDDRSDQKQLTEKNKYETARELYKHLDKIREHYRTDWESEECQLGVALYLIDTLGLRRGNKKQQRGANTFGCCNLKVKHIQLRENNTVHLDFIGKSFVPYQNDVQVEESVYNNLILFKQDKSEEDYIFDKLKATTMDKFLKTHMKNLSIKVFRTYKASTTFENRLNELTHEDHMYKKHEVKLKLLEVFKQANMEVAVLLNHKKKKEKRKKDITELDSTDNNILVYAPETSLRDYIDPRIVVTWCERFGIDIKNVYTTKLCEKFLWAIEEAGPNFIF